MGSVGLATREVLNLLMHQLSVSAHFAPQEFKPTPYGDTVTIGAYVRDLMLSQV